MQCVHLKHWLCNCLIVALSISIAVFHLYHFYHYYHHHCHIHNHLWTVGPCSDHCVHLMHWSFKSIFNCLIVTKWTKMNHRSMLFLTSVCISCIDSCPIANTLKARVGWPLPRSWLKMVDENENGQWWLWERWQSWQGWWCQWSTFEAKVVSLAIS